MKMREPMDPGRIPELLAPYLADEALTPAQLGAITTHFELLRKWNARTNLTALRDPEQIVTRHFGESLFAARQLFPDPQAPATLADVGSGAGFPGLPIAVLRPAVSVTLIEAHGKKATFLKEVIRSTGLQNVQVAQVRAEGFPETRDVVTLRAVEDFARILPICAQIVRPGGRLASMVGKPQTIDRNDVSADCWEQEATVYFPGSAQRVLWILRHLQK